MIVKRHGGLRHMLRRLLGEENGAVAMEYIVIALLVGAAVVALVMVFSGSLRNMMKSTNDVVNAKKTSDVTEAATTLNTQRDNLNNENATAVDAGNDIGGDFGGNCRP